MEFRRGRGAVLRRILAYFICASVWAPAHALECTVEQKVLRDGIVGVPLAAEIPADSGIELSALGKIHDRYSVWRISNPGAEAVRVVLEDVASEYRIPILARARTATFVRSDRVDAMATHRLSVNGAVVNSIASIATEYNDDTPLDDAACAFEGNPLYVAEQQGSLKISTVHGATVAEFPSTAPIETLITEQPGGNVWTLSNGVLKSYSPFGEPLLTIGTPASAAVVAPGGQQLIVESTSGIWLARGQTLDRLALPSGEVLGSMSFDEPIRGLTLDARNNRIWVLLQTSARILKAGVQPSAAIEEVANIPLAGSGRVVAYDSYWSETWVGAASSLTRYDANGRATLDLSGLSIVANDHLVADGAGGLWGANGATMFHVNGSGVIDAQLQPFAGLPGAIVAVAADPADGSVWVASGTRIRNFSREQTLLHDVRPALADGVIRQFRTLELFADRSPPRVWITSPRQGETIDTARPTIVVEFDVQGDVAPATLELRHNQRTLPVDCTQHSTGALCTLATDLPEGEVTIVPSAHDLAGNESISTPRTFTVQTRMQALAAPNIWIYDPWDNGYYNQEQMTIYGGLSEAATLTINGQAVEVNEWLEFAHLVTLQEGANIFTFAAENSDGRTEFDFTLNLDTLPPPPATISLITVVPTSTSSLQITGAAGSVEPYATIRIRNASRGGGGGSETRMADDTYASAEADGSFSVEISGLIGDELSVTVLDAAGNESSLGEQPIANDGSQPFVSLRSTSSTVTTSHILIRGTLSGALDTAVTANGIVATMLGTGVNRQFQVRVPLVSGLNLITVVARRPTGEQFVATREVTRSGTPAFAVQATPSDGVAPLDVEFTIQRHVTDPIVSVTIDFEDDGIDDLTQTARQTRFTHRYTEPGAYNAVFTITARPNPFLPDVVHTILVPIAVLTTETVDGQILAVWQRFKDALAAGDSTTALKYMTSKAAAEYETVFSQLQTQMPAIVASFSAPERSQSFSSFAEFIVRRQVGATEQAFLIYFSRASDGTWRIASL